MSEMQEPLQTCTDNAACPRTAMILRLVNGNDAMRAGTLKSMELQPTPEDLKRHRSLALATYINELNAVHPDGDRPVTPATCPVFDACRKAVEKLNAEMLTRRMSGPSLVNPGQLPPNPRQA